MYIKKGYRPWNKGKHLTFSAEIIEKLRLAARKSNHYIPSTIGRLHTEETKQKMSESRKKLFENGLVHPMFGRHHSSEAKEKIRLSHLGKKSALGTKRTEEQKRKFSEIHKKIYENGSKPPWFGKHLSEERKIKISELHKGNKYNIGKKHSEQTKEKIRLKRLGWAIPSKDTSIEVTLQNALTERGISFTKHRHITGQPDIFIEPNICIFADGCYWHQCEQCFDKNKFIGNQRKVQVHDIFVTQKLINDGYTVFRFWEHEIKKDSEGCVLKIINEIRDVKN